MAALFIIRFGSHRIKLVGGVGFEILVPIVSLVKENEKKIVKIWKLQIMKKKERNGLEVWCMGSLKLPIKFGLDTCRAFRKTDFPTDWRRTPVPRQ